MGLVCRSMVRWVGVCLAHELDNPNRYGAIRVISG